VFLKIYSPVFHSFILKRDLVVKNTCAFEDFNKEVKLHFEDSEQQVDKVLWEDVWGAEGKPKLKLVKNNNFKERVFDGSIFVILMRSNKYFCSFTF
jgi:hypothetical protein